MIGTAEVIDYSPTQVGGGGGPAQRRTGTNGAAGPHMMGNGSGGLQTASADETDHMEARRQRSSGPPSALRAGIGGVFPHWSRQQQWHWRSVV